MLKMHNEDYIVVASGKKNKLALVTDAKARKAVLDDTLATDDPKTITYAVEDVRCNLGPEPAVGKAFGADIEPYIKTIQTQRFGPIHLFTKLDKKDINALKSAMKTMYAKFDKLASTEFLPLHSIVLKSPKGKYAGSYKAQSKGMERLDVMTLHPETFSDVDYNLYLLAHEWAHGLWYRCVPTRVRSRWIKLFQKRLPLSQMGEAYLENLFSDILESETTLGKFAKDADDDRIRELAKDIYGYFKRVHKMDAKGVDLMFQHDSSSVAEMWPTHTTLSEERPDVSEYAMKNVEEFFAESVAFHMIGKIVPKDVRKALDATFKRCKAGE